MSPMARTSTLSSTRMSPTPTPPTTSTTMASNSAIVRSTQPTLRTSHWKLKTTHRASATAATALSKHSSSLHLPFIILSCYARTFSLSLTFSLLDYFPHQILLGRVWVEDAVWTCLKRHQLRRFVDFIDIHHWIYRCSGGAGDSVLLSTPRDHRILCPPS